MTTEFQKLWSSGDSAGLLRLAKDIETQDSWRAFLTIQEHDLFKYAMDEGGKVWHEFINGAAICRMEQPTTIGTPAPSSTMNGASSLHNPAMTPSGFQRLEKSPFPLGQSNGFKVSSPSPMHFERSTGDDTKSTNVDYIQLDTVNVAFRVRYMLYEKSIGLLFPSVDPSIPPEVDYSIFEIEEEKPKPVVPAARKVDDDDYDDDEEDEDESSKPSFESQPTKSNANDNNNEKSVIIGK